ncbi:extracellular solute-binding protein [Mahella australiensis]|uniref:Extracellular solute-binding protein family 1 n=1 Tax=Mahella australiensis (strain DSM 15567 / CIP 107919 / 50-1 BON) TaxID=697281 RepID=F4A0U3_MAHA5|nr:extracellular solute-binding protein [Mahella australiensis]AEE96989.1 extracellular solute-binding protein family 1 [Mahella australiensis 50-1 BON]
MGKKWIAWSLALVLLLSFTLVGCMPEGADESDKQQPEQSETADAGTTEGDTQVDPFGKYPEPIEITACRVKTSWMGFDEGKDENNNWWSETYLDQLNIKLNVVWTAPNWGEPLETKITTCIATDDLPDLMPVYGSLAQRISMAGKAMDVKDVVDKWASPLVKEYLNYADGRALTSAMYDGKMIGIPNPGALDGTYNVVWYRSDWLKKLNLQPPKSLEDIENIARAFRDNDPDGNGKKDTYGIAADKNFGGLKFVKGMFGARDGWIEKDGKLEYGLIQPEIKPALARMHEWYKEGILARDFATKDPNNELQADIAAGKVGLMLDGTHLPNGGAGRALKKNNPDADVEWSLIPTANDPNQPAKQYATSRANDFNVISYKCKHPEAIMKMINLKTAIFEPENKPDFLKDVTSAVWDTSPGGNMEFWNAVVSFDNIGKNYKVAEMVNKEIAEGGDGSDLPVDAKTMFEQMNSWIKEGTKSPNFDVNWAMYKLFNAENGSDLITHKMATAEPDKYWYYDAFGGLDTPAMAKYGSDIATKSQEYFIKAVMEGNVDENFDAWVKYFHNNGGDLMTQEANEWYQKSKNQ